MSAAVADVPGAPASVADGAALLDQLQALVAQINDVPVECSVSRFHLPERNRCATLLGRPLAMEEDEQLLIQDGDGEAALALYVDAAVLRRLARRSPLHELCDDNLGDFCTVLEGVSHFQYVVWCAERSRQLSLLELELQGEVDKYAAAVCLLLRQGRHGLARGVHRRLFEDVRFLPGLAADILQRYVEAHRAAAHFCAALERRFLRPRHFRPERWLRAVRECYRRSHHQKLRYALN